MNEPAASSPASQTAPVLIAGAGPVGLGLALALARQGIRSIVIEEDPGLNQHSRAAGIHMRTMEVLHAWGVLEPFLEEGQLVSQVQAWAVGETTPRLRFDFTPLRRETRHPGVLVLPQDRTEALLYAAVQAAGCTEVLFGHRLQSFTQEASGVEIVVQNVATGETSSRRGEYLVGCDGGRSTVRHALGWELEGTTYPATLMLADVRLGDARDELPWPRVVPQGDGTLASMRVSRELWRIISTLRPGDEEDEGLRPGLLADKVRQLFGPGDFTTAWSSIFRIHCRKARHWVSGRVLLAGDAAHLNSPAGGQGMNTGLQDAHNLAWKLARILRGAPAAPLLASYEEERQAAFTRYVEPSTDFLTRNLLLGSKWRRALVFAAAKVLSVITPLRKRAARRIGMLAQAYHHSPLLTGSHPLVGQRAPEGELFGTGGRTVWLQDLCWPEGALLHFTESPTREIPAPPGAVPWYTICRHGRAVGRRTFIEPGGELWARWGAKPGMVALVRPDGYVGWVAQNPSAAEVQQAIAQCLGEVG